MKTELEKFKTRWRRWLGNKTRQNEPHWVTLLDANWLSWVNSVMGEDYYPISLNSTREQVKVALISEVKKQAKFQHDAGYGGYTREQLTAHNMEAVEDMAQKQKYRKEIKKFSRKEFSKHYPISMGRSSIYNYVREQDWNEIEKMYITRCREIRGET